MCSYDATGIPYDVTGDFLATWKCEKWWTEVGSCEIKFFGCIYWLPLGFLVHFGYFSQCITWIPWNWSINREKIIFRRPCMLYTILYHYIPFLFWWIHPKNPTDILKTDQIWRWFSMFLHSKPYFSRYFRNGYILSRLCIWQYFVLKSSCRSLLWLIDSWKHRSTIDQLRLTLINPRLT